MLKILSLFSGIGAFEKALENIDEPFELINYCEIDKYASKAFSLIHAVNESLNLGDITAIDTATLPNDIDVITYGFPCQDISNAGKQAGFTDENGDLTRSGLFFEALRVIEDTQPKFAIAENVKALTSKKFTAEFKIVLNSLNDAGYKNYWAVLNAKDYGVPQNRERVFIISIRDDIDHGFTFPEKYELKLKLKDVLETNVDEKFFLTDEMLKKFIVFDEPTQGEIKQIGNCKPTRTRQSPNQGRVYDINGISPTLNCCGGGNLQPYIRVREATKKGYAETKDGDFINLQFPNSKTRRERVGNQISQTLLCNDANGVVVNDTANVLQIENIVDDTNIGFKNPQRGKIYDPDEISPTLTCMQGGGLEPKIVINEPNTALIQPKDRDYKKKGLKRETQIEAKTDGISHALRTNGETYVVEPPLCIRKLTPKECFRLMGFDDRDIDILIDNKISNTQLYKMAGNSIVVDILEEIYVELLNQYCEVV